MITDREELRKRIKTYCKPQTQIAQEMGVNLVYFNQFLHRRAGVGGLQFQIKANDWLDKQNNR